LIGDCFNSSFEQAVRKGGLFFAKILIKSVSESAAETAQG
jgi:hypothetical protein